VAFGLTVAAVQRARVARALSASDVRSLGFALGGLALWVLASSTLGLTGAYLHRSALQFLPLLVGFLVPSLFVTVLLWRQDTFRSAVRSLILWLPLRWLLGVHAIRITALGTIIKYLNGELPAHFILPVGVPDFFVGLSALPLALWVSPTDPFGRRCLIAWNIAGSLVFAYAGLALHFSVPGPLQLFTSGPTTESIFRFPLVLVPTFLVPFFVGLHAATLWRLSARAA
jgi:hypothetical protein